MTWGDVLCAALDACRTVGPNCPVDPEKLPEVIAKILDVTGDDKSTYSKGVKPND